MQKEEESISAQTQRVLSVLDMATRMSGKVSDADSVNLKQIQAFNATLLAQIRGLKELEDCTVAHFNFAQSLVGRLASADSDKITRQMKIVTTKAKVMEDAHQRFIKERLSYINENIPRISEILAEDASSYAKDMQLNLQKAVKKLQETKEELDKHLCKEDQCSFDEAVSSLTEKTKSLDTPEKIKELLDDSVSQNQAIFKMVELVFAEIKDKKDIKFPSVHEEYKKATAEVMRATVLYTKAKELSSKEAKSLDSLQQFIVYLIHMSESVIEGLERLSKELVAENVKSSNQELVEELKVEEKKSDELSNLANFISANFFITDNNLKTKFEPIDLTEVGGSEI